MLRTFGFQSGHVLGSDQIRQMVRGAAFTCNDRSCVFTFLLTMQETVSLGT